MPKFVRILDSPGHTIPIFKVMVLHYSPEDVGQFHLLPIYPYPNVAVFNCLSSLKYDVIFAQRKMFFTIYIFTYLCLFIVCAYVGSCVGRYNDMEICLSVPTKEVYWDSL